jgi:hypothetical protein
MRVVCRLASVDRQTIVPVGAQNRWRRNRRATTAARPMR